MLHCGGERKESNGTHALWTAELIDSIRQLGDCFAYLVLLVWTKERSNDGFDCLRIVNERGFEPLGLFERKELISKAHLQDMWYPLGQSRLSCVSGGVPSTVALEELQIVRVLLCVRSEQAASNAWATCSSHAEFGVASEWQRLRARLGRVQPIGATRDSVSNVSHGIDRYVLSRRFDRPSQSRMAGNMEP